MEIGPIPGIRNLPVVKAPPAEAGLAGVYDIENFARVSDETYTPSGGQSAGGHEDEFDDEFDEPVEEEVTVEGEAASPYALAAPPPRKISFFA